MNPSILDEILASKRREVAEAKRRMPIDELEARAAEAPPVRDFRSSLAGPGPIRLIAEVKKASPSAGLIRADFDPVAIARTYQAHGADCLSVLTDAPHFRGHLSHLARVRASVAIPLLRKDFLIDEYQVVEARMAGADAVLLIAEILEDAQLDALQARARSLGMAALVELHDEANLDRVLHYGADLVGVNNRDLSPVRHRSGADLPPPTPSPRGGPLRQRERHPRPTRCRASRSRWRRRHPRRRVPDALPRHRRRRRGPSGSRR